MKPSKRSFDMSLSQLGARDEDLSFYLSWLSSRSQSHSKNIAQINTSYTDRGFYKWKVREADVPPSNSQWLFGKEHGHAVYCYEIEVHFTGKMLDGTVFASSRENGTAPYKFLSTEAGDVMHGFILAIATMGPGEKAVFTIPAKLAVAKSGCPASIPWNIPSEQDLRFDIELISLTADVLNDKGILKKITKLGIGYGYPCDLDEVFVNYHILLEDGTSVCKSEGVEFSLAEGFFCPAFAHAVKTMTEGEEAALIIEPEYGFGEQGRPSTGNEAAVPPDATLHVNLQLVTWKKVRYIGESQEILMKTPQNEGNCRLSESESAYDGAVVRVNLIGKLQDGTVFYRSGEQPFEFMFGQGSVLEEAILAMERQVASVVIPPQHAFGTVGSNEYELAVVPPNSVVIYDIVLLSVDGCIPSWVRPCSVPVRRRKHGHKRRKGTLLGPLLPAARPSGNTSQSPVSSALGSAAGESSATATLPAVGSSSAGAPEENQSSNLCCWLLSFRRGSS